MIRLTAALAVTLALSPSWLGAQSVEFVVNTTTTSVRLSPSTASPVIGEARRGG